MSTASSFIILRDIPKEEARLDLEFFNIQGGFRGFQLVPAGVHYVSVLSDGKHQGFWCYLQPNEALVKVFNYTRQEFEDDEVETSDRYQQLALGGAMNQSLIAYNLGYWLKWEKLTNRISADNFPPILHQESSSHPQQKSRFEQALFDTHSGDISAFLAEFQFAFVRWLIDPEDIPAFNRWGYQLQAIYNAGESGIAKAPELFPSLIDTLIAQFDCLPEEMFTPDSFIVSGADYLAEDMTDSAIEGVMEKGQEFAAYLEKLSTQ